MRKHEVYNLMNKSYIKIAFGSILISIIGVFIIDYFSHLLLSSPMETLSYFMAKSTLYFIFSIIFLSIFNLKEKEFIKVSAVGVSNPSR